MKDLILYNPYHNGDLFYSRILLNMILNENKINIKYFHAGKLNLFCDIQYIEEYDISSINNLSNLNEFNVVNTWIGQNNRIYLNSINTGCSYENHFFLAKKLATDLGIKVEDDMNKYIPTINYDILPNIDNIKNKIKHLKSKYEKIVLISNGDVHSGQAVNFDFSYIINILANTKSNVLFLITKECGINSPNVMYTSQITEIIPDLLHISYISNFCDIIIGRASGPFCFCHTKENMLNENKTFISFCNNQDEGVFYKKQKSKYFWSNNYDNTNILSVIYNSNSI